MGGHVAVGDKNWNFEIVVRQQALGIGSRRGRDHSHSRQPPDLLDKRLRSRRQRRFIERLVHRSPIPFSSKRLYGIRQDECLV
jgi:hypothetical protein